MNTDSHNKGDCGTSFKSSAKLREFDNGPSIGYIKEDGQYIWPDAQAGNVIEFDVKTKESDTCVAKLTTMDLEYVAKLTEAVTLSLGDDATPDQIMDAVMAEIDMARFFLVVRSKTFTTDGSGEYTGKFTIENTFREMPLMLLLHYGYSGNAERSDWETAWDVIGEEVLWLIVEELVFALICAAIVAACVGTCVGVVGTVYALRVAKITKRVHTASKAARVTAKGKKTISLTGKAMTGVKATWKSKAIMKSGLTSKKLYYMGAAANMATFMGAYAYLEQAKDGFGMIDINKSGCQFPAGGYNDIYSFQVGGGDEEWLTFLSTMTPESMGYMTAGLETEEASVLGAASSSPFLVYGGLALVGIVVMLLFSKEEEGGGA